MMDPWYWHVYLHEWLIMVDVYGKWRWNIYHIPYMGPMGYGVVFHGYVGKDWFADH